MRIQRHKSFTKDYQKLQPTQKVRLQQAITLFMAEPYHADLYNHGLKGEWTGYRSISFGGDWRAHYKVVDGVSIFVACGTHSQLYR